MRTRIERLNFVLGEFTNLCNTYWIPNAAKERIIRLFEYLANGE